MGDKHRYVNMLCEELQLEILRNERVFVAEAQETARLLHGVSDERSLVHDFPWWQMISCLICASSILLVATRFGLIEYEAGERYLLNEDAQICLKALEILAANSDGARIGRDMLQRLHNYKASAGMFQQSRLYVLAS